jgi:hypothetical protein
MQTKLQNLHYTDKKMSKMRFSSTFIVENKLKSAPYKHFSEKMSKTGSARCTYKPLFLDAVFFQIIMMQYADTIYGLVLEKFLIVFENFFCKNTKQKSIHFFENGHFWWTKKCPKLKNCKISSNKLWNLPLHYGYKKAAHCCKWLEGGVGAWYNRMELDVPLFILCYIRPSFGCIIKMSNPTSDPEGI